MLPLSVPTSSATAASSGLWTLTLVVGLLRPVSPTSALSSVNASSSEYTKDHLPTSTLSRCVPASDDVLWTRLNMVAPRLTLLYSNDNEEDDGGNSLTHLSPVSNYDSSSYGEFQSSPSNISQTVATSTTGSRHRQHGRRRRGRRRWWRRRGGRGRPGGGDRRRSAPTSWNCQLQKRWKRMPSDVFPTYVQTGSCRRQPTCMLGMYACRPRRYLVKVLRRVSADGSDDGCRPVPVAGRHVVYEEAWSLVDVSVTVACECSKRRRSGTYYHRPFDNT